MVENSKVARSFKQKSKATDDSSNKSSKWDALDQERADSMINEGGSSALENQKLKARVQQTTAKPQPLSWKRAAFIAGATFFYSLSKMYHHKNKK